MSVNSKIRRRDFLRISALGTAGTLLLPTTFSCSSKEKKVEQKSAANDKINIGFIGLGQQAMYLLHGFISMPEVRVVAGCDVYDVKRNRFEKRVKDFYTSEGEKSCEVKMYEDYQPLLEDKSIDAVVIATPDHQHAVIAIAACKAGKDVYLEKPMTLTIYEGQQLCKAVRKYNRILQVGSQQRSSDEFTHAATLAREGLLGKINNIDVYVGRIGDNPTASPTPYPLVKQELPKGLNWDKWLGPLPESIHYNSDLNPIISLDPKQDEQLWGAWRWYKEMGGGLMTDWGAHMFDAAQWATGKDGSGPVEIVPNGYKDNNHLTLTYDNGIKITEQKFDGGKQGLKIYGDKGWIQVCRGELLASDENLSMQTAKEKSNIPYETKVGHYQSFINSVISRNDPNVPVETGHTSCVVCTLGNIANELKRPVTWNPIVQKFMNDPEATKLLHYDYRNGYSLEV